MATVNLLPNADVSNSPAWTLSTGSDVYALLDDEAGDDSTVDGNKITATAIGKKCIVEFENLGVSFDSINSVQAIVRATVPERNQTYALGIRILDSSSTELWAQEASAAGSTALWVTHTFTERTTDGTDAWTKSDIDGIRMEIENTAMSGGTLSVGYVYFIIDYDPTLSLYINGLLTLDGKLTIK